MPAKITIFLLAFMIMAPVVLAYEVGQTDEPPIILPEININLVLNTIKSIFNTANQIINVSSLFNFLPSNSQSIPNIQIGGGEAVSLVSSVLQQIYQAVSGLIGPIINQIVGQLLPNILNR